MSSLASQDRPTASAGMRRLLRRTPVQIAAFLATLPIALMATMAAFESQQTFYPWGDHAVVELETIEAGRHGELLGTYSRYQWHHPGPVLFYLLQPVYQLLGESTGAMNAGAALINLAATAIVIAVAVRLGGLLVGLWAGTVIGVFLASIELDLRRDFWIPHVVVLSVAALAMLCGALASGRIWYLPAVAAAACFLCETDLSVSPSVVAMSVGGLGLCLFNRRSGRESDREGARLPAWAPYAVAALVIAVMVAPPVYEQLTNDPGNLTRLWDFFRTPAPTHSLREAVGAVATALSVLPGGDQVFDDGVRAGGAAKALFIVAMALLAAGAVLAWRRRDSFAVALCAIALVGILGGVVGVTRIRGPVHPYLVFWLSSLALVAWIAIGAALGPGLAGLLRRGTRRPLVPAAGVLLALLLGAVTTLNVVAVTREPSVRTVRAYSDPQVKALVTAADRYMAARAIRKPAVFIAHPERWPDAAGLVLQLRRDERSVSVQDQWLFMFGKRHALDGDEDGSLTFATTGRAQEGVSPPPGHQRIAIVGETVLYGKDSGDVRR